MTMCKKKMTTQHITTVGFYGKQELGLSLDIYFTIKKSLIKRFITKYALNIRFIISQA